MLAKSGSVGTLQEIENLPVYEYVNALAITVAEQQDAIHAQKNVK